MDVSLTGYLQRNWWQSQSKYSNKCDNFLSVLNLYFRREEEPLNADESEEQENVILNAIEQRVKARNVINAARMASRNVVLADEVFARNAMVSLLIPIQNRLAGELRRVYCRVVQHTRGGYQLNTAWGLLSGRYPHDQLNGLETDTGEIPRLTVQASQTASKITLANAVASMNARGPISTAQRAGRKKLLGKRKHSAVSEVEASSENSDTAAENDTADVIEVEPHSIPAAAVAVRGRGRRRGRGRGRIS
jgi:hypothetical protein